MMPKSLYTTRNYELAMAKVIRKQLEKYGYIKLRNLLNEYHPKFMIGLHNTCKRMVANGKLVYDEKIRAYKKPQRL